MLTSYPYYSSLTCTHPIHNTINTNSLKCSGDYQKDTPEGRYLRFGVREHGMAAICNGIFAYGGYRPFGATFLNFIGYAQGAVRLSALSRFGESPCCRSIPNTALYQF
jgi:transketolase